MVGWAASVLLEGASAGAAAAGLGEEDIVTRCVRSPVQAEGVCCCVADRVCQWRLMRWWCATRVRWRDVDNGSNESGDAM